MGLLNAEALAKLQEAAGKTESDATDEEESTDVRGEGDGADEPDEVSDAVGEAGDEEASAETEAESEGDDESVEAKLTSALTRLDERLNELDKAKAEPPTKSEDEKWYDEYVTRSASYADDDLGDSDLAQLQKTVRTLEHDRAVHIARAQLERQVREAHSQYKSVPVFDIVQAVHASPGIDPREWAKVESQRLVASDARIRAEVRKELRMEKRETADERSPPAGRSSSPPKGGGDKGKAPKTLRDARDAVLRRLDEMGF